MADSDIARELVDLGLPWLPGMVCKSKIAPGPRVVMVAIDHLRVSGPEHTWFVSKSMSIPDLSDKATLALVEDWVRGLWFARGCVCWEYEEIMSGENAGHMYVAWHELQCGSRVRCHRWKRTEKSVALLAAARAALGGG